MSDLPESEVAPNPTTDHIVQVVTESVVEAAPENIMEVVTEPLVEVIHPIEPKPVLFVRPFTPKPIKQKLMSLPNHLSFKNFLKK